MTTNDRVSGESVTGFTDEEMNEMFDQFVSSPGFTVREYLEEINGDTSQWIYDDLLCDSWTCFYGAPEARKSTLACNIAAAYSKGEPVLGRAPRSGGEPKNVLILGTETNLKKEYAERLLDLGADLDRVGVIRVYGDKIPEEAYSRARNGAIDLVVIDNVTGFSGEGTINNDEALKHFKRMFEPFEEYGVPVLAIHHAGKNGQLQGNQQFRALFRHFVKLGKGRSGKSVRLTPQGNLGDFPAFDAEVQGRFRLTLPEGADKPKQSRSPEVLDSVAEVWEFAKESKATSQRAVAREVAPRAGLSESTVRRHLDAGVKNGHLTRNPGAVPFFT